MNKNDIINQIRQTMVDYEDMHPSVDVDDQAIVQRILQELQLKIGDEYEPFRNIEELSQYDIPGAGPIVAKYIRSLKSQMDRSCLLHHLLGSRAHRCARVKNCTELVWQLFLDFLSSDAYFDTSILNAYNNAFARLKPKQYSAELLELSKNPYLFNNMPTTMRMLASWQFPGFQDILLDYFMHPQRIAEYLSEYSLNGQVHIDEEQIKKEINWWEHSGKYTAISGLKYYPSEQTSAMLKQYADNLEEEMKVELGKCADRYAKSDVRYRYSSLLKTLRESILYIEKELSAKNHSGGMK